MTDLPQAVVAEAESTLSAFLEPWLAADAYGTALASQIPTAARLVLRDAAPHIAAAERERIRRAIATLADKIDHMTGHLTGEDRMVAAETLRELATEGRLDQLATPGTEVT